MNNSTSPRLVRFGSARKLTQAVMIGTMLEPNTSRQWNFGG